MDQFWCNGLPKECESLNNLEEDYMLFEIKIRTFGLQWYKPKKAHHILNTPQWIMLVGALYFCDATLRQELEKP